MNCLAFVYDNAGAAVNAAAISIFPRNTTSSATTTTTTNSSGFWSVSGVAEGRYDVQAVVGNATSRLKYDDEIQLDRMEVANFLIRNPADTFAYDIVPSAITAARQLTLPLIAGTDTLVTLGLSSQAFAAIVTFSAGITISAGGTLDMSGGAYLSGGGVQANHQTLAADTNLTLDENDSVVSVTLGSSSDNTITLPAASGNEGMLVHVYITDGSGTNNAVVTRAGSDTISNGSGDLSNTTVTLGDTGDFVFLQLVNSSTWSVVHESGTTVG